MSESNGSVSNTAAAENNESNAVPAYFEVDEVVPHRFGDFGGALSWPMPLSVSQKGNVLLAASHYLNRIENPESAYIGVLDYLNGEVRLSDDALRDAPSALEKLITGARGQALGLAVQNRLNGIATDVSVNEYAMAGIQLVLYQGSLEDPQRNTVAGFDLAGEKHWGKPASAIFNNLVEYLVKAHLSSRRMAQLTANLLLVWKAPALLISDLPDHLKYGSAAWFNLAVAAQTIEAQTPGKVAYMTFAQVMASAESAAQADPDVTLRAQTAALVDWGVVNGLLGKRSDDLYTHSQLEDVKTHFNDQLADRLNASIQLNSEFPSRKEIALARLKERFTGDVPFEERLLEQETAEGGDGVFLSADGWNGKYSLLDIAMTGSSRPRRWKTRDARLLLHLNTINELHNLDVPQTFQTRFDNTLGKLKDGVRLTISHLISELPLEDRKNLEYGGVTFFQHKTYKSNGHWGKDLQSTDAKLTIKTELGRDTTVYNIHLNRGVIERVEFTQAVPGESYDTGSPSIQYATESFHAFDKSVAAKLLPTTAILSTTPASYASARTQTIADVFVKHLDLDNEKILKDAKGQTTKEREDAAAQRVIDFVLDLIPFKSAISNFIKGNYAEGAVDLFMDVLGFVTAGAGAVAKVAKIGAKTASAIGKTLKAAKIIGAVVIGELNPLSGLTGLVTGGTRLLGKGVNFVGNQSLHYLNKLRGASGSYDLLRVAGRQHGPTLIGVWKLGEESVDGVGVLKNGQFYQLNPVNNRLYGPPGDFRPKPGRLGLGGLDNKDLGRFAVKASEIAGLEANAQGIFRSADGERFYIRNFDETGTEAVYQIRNDFTRSSDFTDVILVDPATNRTHGARLWQVAPDQWQPLAIRGGNLTDEIKWIPSPITRQRLQNGLSEPIIEAITTSEVAHLSRNWGDYHIVPFTASPTNIHHALSGTEFAQLSISCDLFNSKFWSNPLEKNSLLTNREGGATMIFSMQRMKTTGAVKTEFNALRALELQAGEVPGKIDSVHGFWVAQGGYVDIPVHPGWADADHVFTPGFGGCSFVVDQMGDSTLRVRHVEGSKEAAQYNNLSPHEHGMGQSAAMEFTDYGVGFDLNGNADTMLTGFSYLKYDRAAKQWKIHYQSQYGAPVINSYSKNDAGWFKPSTRMALVYPQTHIVKTGTKPVITVANVAKRGEVYAAIPA
ncbi:hypothetical protein PS718_00799 [Pseudomonas fluorescens]|uniref:Uncharacterized protein n=1 Tax=Pseudomonas fluorescens TaxID=294 RepID=A0A5E7AJK9_PSEFL|nr:hypothetical protein [Pseudomonas fluorescens]VVN76874.1 hypothetical protein PS718_00799 [Pseudomonas fluorescens]